jgi:hypothetical protein
VACCVIKAPVARDRGFSDIWQRAQRWRNRAVIDEMLSDAELKQWRTREQIREIDGLSYFSREIDDNVQTLCGAYSRPGPRNRCRQEPLSVPI